MSTSRTPISQLEQGQIDQTFAVLEAVAKIAKNGSSFVSATVGDRTGEMRLIRFDCDEPPDAGAIYRVEGRIELYRGDLQINALNWSKSSDHDPKAFVKCSPIEGSKLRRTLEAEIAGLSGEVGAVVSVIFDPHLLEAFLEAPASQKNHHAYQGGLAEHTVSMLGLAECVAQHYEGLYGPIDLDLLKAGVLLHDLGKVFDHKKDGFSWTSTDERELTGHIVECACLISDACMTALASTRTRLRLMHMVAAHHGKAEWGSPVDPKFFEAELLHLIDMIDSRRAMFFEATAGLERGEFTEWNRTLRRRVTSVKNPSPPIDWES